MVFSSTFFLFAFLPAVIICYYTLRLLFNNRLRNVVLLVFSYMFYLYGAAGFLLILVFSTLADYLFGFLIDRDQRRKRLWLSLSVFLNLGLLAYFKYANFFIEELNIILQYLGFSPAGWENVILPIGISFFTFQKLSYVIDVYRGKCRALVCSSLNYGWFSGHGCRHYPGFSVQRSGSSCYAVVSDSTFRYCLRLVLHLWNYPGNPESPAGAAPDRSLVRP